ncbi:unnamed protein product [Mucor hiemalis]
MGKEMEKNRHSDEKKAISIGSGPVKRDRGRCFFGLLSLRSGIYVVSAVSVSSVIFSLYGLLEEPPISDENLYIIGTLQRWTSSAFLCQSFCTEVIGLYGAYKKSARLIKKYKQWIGIGLGLELALSGLELTRLYKVFKKLYTSRAELIDPESLAEWVRNSGEKETWAQNALYVTIVCAGTVGIMIPIAVEVITWLKIEYTSFTYVGIS